ncbi:MAG TPA: tRNA uridine-5-carboxymethylaminomethyl(34) synthesis GTPase MnmE [Candidatus Latescibacteria bacterium]|nr:tRNA uridine-5-carboxymethylaminomethyl(34) synthesis GTPase MnmE [Candidatus Latescibacterota bacterium]
MLEDTIIAISTPPGFGGLGIVRLSGKRALAVAGQIFRPKKRSKKLFPERCQVFGAIRDPERKTDLDEAFLTYFKAPRSYTREDVVELSSHGSPAVLAGILRLGVAVGARLAQPGEFTLRAYLNGRLDMLQAEAVDDLIRSVSLTQARVSSLQLGGSLSRRIFRLRGKLITLLSRMEAGLEFPDEKLRTGAWVDGRAINSLAAEVERLVVGYETGRAIREGLTLAITGRTNVGKSTLFNALLEEDRAIVTPFPGTTRDYLREKLVIDDIVFHLVDMAGLGKPVHPVDKTGIARGQKIARDADGLLVVLDASRKESWEDERLVRKYRAKKMLLVFNKSDLPLKIARRRIRDLAGGSPSIDVSALKGLNIDKLRVAIRGHFVSGPAKEEDVILHARQKDLLQAILEALRRAAGLLAKGHSIELYTEEIRNCLPLVGELTGEVRIDEVIDDIFKRFCVGK